MAFFEGSLQEGIGAALQQSKSVVCFVTGVLWGLFQIRYQVADHIPDEQDESQTWENEYLKEEEIVGLLQATSVTLRLVAGSQEEGFLAQLYPLPKKPTLVIIKDGQLKEYIAAGVTKELFLERLQKALSPVLSPPPPPPTQPEAAASPAVPVADPVMTTQPVITPQPATAPQPVSVEDSNPSSSGQTTPPSSNEQSHAQSMAAQTATRIERMKKAEAEAKKRREEEAKRRREEKGKANEDPTKPATAHSQYAETLKKKQKEAREERQRILKQIEDDKAERKARQEALEAERKATTEASTAPFAPASQVFPRTGKLSSHASIQVRLFDGSTLRSRFSSTNTLKDVRQWVTDNRKDGKKPFNFKILLTPLPSKTVDVTEEEKTLQELELTPSATLILLPVPKHSSAYSRSSGGSSASSTNSVREQGSLFQRVIAFIVVFYTMIGAFFTTLFGTSSPPAGQEADDGDETPRQRSPTRGGGQQQQQQQQQTQGTGDRRIGGLESLRRRNEQQFYNGNSTNFQPRPDDEE
ncbi:hypothetical protein B0T21DRAFT_57596 [Apiosordaria backusii]|uniref:UBX domain-containing protein n=1 Tax=Apiosordaria backusii TaxID=314023 RepID=A0AA40E150_9PEZI|nr:hypothetical protein B0T21DRAFT_57596 [Apiosordaria backusii]